MVDRKIDEYAFNLPRRSENTLQQLIKIFTIHGMKDSLMEELEKTVELFGETQIPGQMKIAPMNPVQFVIFQLKKLLF